MVENKDYLQEFLPDLPEFGEKIAAFDKGDITVADYKKFSGGFGSYAQKGAKSHMLRLRLTGGVISKEKLKAIAEIAKKHNSDMAKLTTCESVQLHNLPANEVAPAMEEAWRAGMISRGGGGDFPRNVMCSPLAGVAKDEPFDVRPYAKATAEYLLSFIKGDKFPRKLKVCFSNGDNVPHATFRDLGFVAKENGKFDVYAAGGLGNGPMLGVKVYENAEPSQVLYFAKAMVKTFLKHGNYENRAKARTRFMREKLGGDEAFITEYNAILAETIAEGRLDIEVSPEIITKTGNGSTISDKRAIEQKQEGLYAVYYHPITGQLNPEKFAEIYEVIKDMQGVEIRLDPESALYVVNLNGDEAAKVLSVTDDGANTLFETSTCCVGPTTCQGGIGRSPELLCDCVQAVREAGIPDGALPKIGISGCPSSCAAHQVFAIGFRGAKKPNPADPKNPFDAFAIFLGGSAKPGEEKIAEAGKIIKSELIPEMLVEIGRTVAETGKTYEEWIKDNENTLNDIVNKYAAL